jgi:transcription initiation factor TFIIIB Brf1 subunit/transcription initiation factor TFIIB
LAWLGYPRAGCRITDRQKNLSVFVPELFVPAVVVVRVYRASDERDNEEWLADLQEAADRLELGTEARSRASDVFLSTVPDADRSKRAAMAAALYVGALAAGQQRSQSEVADAVGVSRLSVQKRWKEALDAAGLDPPDW